MSTAHADLRVAPSPKLVIETSDAPVAALVRSDRHLPVLDGLRGIAILLVLLLHFGRGSHPTLLGKLFFAVTNFGWIGVDLFFVLSGFLITGILIDSKGATHYFRDFYARRALRIFPLYYATLILVFVAVPLLRRLAGGPWRAPAHQWWFWTYATSAFPLLDPAGYLGKQWSVGLGHFWSLAVEEHFYFVWPLLVFLLTPRRLMALCAALIFGAILARMAYFATLKDPLPEGPSFAIAVHWFTLFRMDSLATGALLAAGVRGRGGVPALVRPAWWVLGCTATLVTAFALWRRGDTLPSHLVVQTVGYSLLALMFAALILLAVAGAGAGAPGAAIATFSSLPVLRFFGKYSYGIYVFHHLFMYRLEAATAPLAERSYVMWVLVRITLGMALSVLLALLSWHLFEKHFLRMKSRFNYDRGHRAVAAG